MISIHIIPAISTSFKNSERDGLIDEILRYNDGFVKGIFVQERVVDNEIEIFVGTASNQQTRLMKHLQNRCIIKYSIRREHRIQQSTKSMSIFSADGISEKK